MRSLRRLTAVGVAALLTVTGFVNVPAARADRPLTGTCVVSLDVHRTFDVITFDTSVLGVCLLNTGEAGTQGGRLEVEGSLGRMIAGVPHTCQRSLGSGSATMTLYTEIDDVEREIELGSLVARQAQVGGMVELAFAKAADFQEVVATATLAELPSVHELCTSPSADVSWFGDLTFEAVIPT